MKPIDSKPTPPRRQRELAQHRREILEAAVFLFAEKGYHQATMQMIAERAEFSVGYLYKHFAGKEEMYRELVLFHASAIDEIKKEIATEELSPLTRLRRDVEAVSEHFNRYPYFMRVFHQEIGGGICELAEIKQRHYEELRDELESALQAGELKPCDPGLLAAAFQGATKEILGAMAAKSGDRRFDSFPDVIFDMLIEPLRN